jgi:hypothetical protein
VWGVEPGSRGISGVASPNGSLLLSRQKEQVDLGQYTLAKDYCRANILKSLRHYDMFIVQIFFECQHQPVISAGETRRESSREMVRMLEGCATDRSLYGILHGMSFEIV